MQTITKEVSAEIEVKKSRFQAYLVPYKQFRSRLDILRREHPKANHHVTAFRYMNEYRQVVEGSRDDGEPSGTSGPPSLKVLAGHDLIDVGVIIVRYFGGTKLGTGGLARAYAQATGAAVKAASLCDWIHLKSITMDIGFNGLSQLERDCAVAKLNVLERTYHEEGILVKITGEEDTVDDLVKKWSSSALD